MSQTVAESIAEDLQGRGITRVFGLCGGHIQPIWDALSRVGVEIVDVRHEAAAVYMAHAAAELEGAPTVALVTAGPGVTNAATGIANAAASGVPVVVISGRTPRPQTGMGAMQDLAQSAVVAPLCRSVHQLWHQRHILAELDAAFASALGVDGRPGPVYIDFPVDLQEEIVELMVTPRPRPRALPRVLPAGKAVQEAAALIRGGTKVLVISGRGALDARAVLPAFLDQVGGVYLDSAESKGLVADDNPRCIPAMRAKAIRQADLVITLGRRLDFQLGYGSDAVFSPDATFLRVGRNYSETGENRRPEVELHADVEECLTALLEQDIGPSRPDVEWVRGLQRDSSERVRELSTSIASSKPGTDGRMHPYSLIHELNALIDENTIVVADGGDILSFARVGLKAPTYLDCGPLGCLGIGIPFANAAAISQPGRPVVALIGDGSFGFHVAELDTAVRHGASVLYVVANNEAWNIERHDQIERFAGNLVGVDLPAIRYDQVAQGLGAHGERVECVEDLAPALSRARAHLPAVVDVLVTRDGASPDFRSGLASVPSYQALASWDDAERGLRAGAL